MWTLMWIAWWALTVGATWQAAKAWGTAPAIATFIGLYLASWILPFGSLLTAAGAVAIGARAETAQQKQLAIYSH